MQKLLFPVFLAILFIFVVFFGWSTYNYYQAIHSDDTITPYLSVSSWNTTIGRWDIAIDMTSGEEYEIQEDDIIITKEATLATIHWPDHSTTRLWSSSRATIRRMRVVDDYSAIEVEYSLEQGKAWNNVVRTLYPGSYFRARLPENSVIAWVRGTVFEINLDKNYIYSVDHSVALSDWLGRVAMMLPGDVVDARDILKKLWQTILDSAWIQINLAQDLADNLLHSSQAQKSLETLKQARNMGDRFVRWILSFFDSFRDIKIIESIEGASLEDTMTNIPKEYLLKWYQRFQDKNLVQQRENIRKLVIHTWTSWDDYIDAIARGAIWDKMSFSGMTLQSTDALIGTYAKNIDAKIQWVLNVVPVSELQNKAKETLRTLLK